CCPVTELRQYTLHPGQRDALIDLFDREFVETQEDAGIRVMGQFRDLDRPDRFAWMRGFPDMVSRAFALGAFYDGPVWQAHRAAANATMIDSSNALLLRPAHPQSGFILPFGAQRPPRGARGDGPGFMAATLCPLRPSALLDAAEFFATRLRPRLAELGAARCACFVTEPATNSFPRLPVREGENMLAWFMLFGDEDGHRRHLAAARESVLWERDVLAPLAPLLAGPAETLRLVPTARSQLHG
ncbi:MAG TPA: NIPSNAP family protein, partial [Dongiaceae bacterium]